MNKKLQDYVWSILPKEFKEEVKFLYKSEYVSDRGYQPTSTMVHLDSLFGHHNLTSDAEGEEMLTVPRKKVQEKWQRAYKQEAKYSRAQDSPGAREELYYNSGILFILDTLFGSKCLPDKLNEDNFAKSEPKNEGTRQEQCVPKNAESGTHSFNHILKDGFRNERRLNIATQITARLYANYKAASQFGSIEALVRKALDIADTLIFEAEKGGLK